MVSSAGFTLGSVSSPSTTEPAPDRDRRAEVSKRDACLVRHLAVPICPCLYRISLTRPAASRHGPPTATRVCRSGLRRRTSGVRPVTALPPVGCLGGCLPVAAIVALELVAGVPAETWRVLTAISEPRMLVPRRNARSSAAAVRCPRALRCTPVAAAFHARALNHFPNPTSYWRKGIRHDRHEHLLRPGSRCRPHPLPQSAARDVRGKPRRMSRPCFVGQLLAMTKQFGKSSAPEAALRLEMSVGNTCSTASFRWRCNPFDSRTLASGRVLRSVASLPSPRAPSSPAPRPRPGAARSSRLGIPAPLCQSIARGGPVNLRAPTRSARSSQRRNGAGAAAQAAPLQA